jgi:Carboxypeptidase regulatory-like domain/TonB-dependent Receptor Plug Domain
MRPSWIAALAALAVLPGSAAAQATIVGRVINDSSKAPIEGAEIALEQGGRKVHSDADGRFTVDSVPSGIGFAVIRKIGFRPVRLRTLIFGEDTLEVDVRLRPSVVELEPIEVTASSVPVGMEPFAERRLAGFGTFIDGSVLRDSEARQLSDLLRDVRGIRMTRSNGFKTVVTNSRGNCPMAIWLDGQRIYYPGSPMGTLDIDQFTIQNLEAVEVYAGPAETPSELGGTGAGCGTLVLWSRRP